VRIALATLLLALVAVAPSAGFVDPGAREPVDWEPATPEAKIAWRRSVALGEPSAGRLVRGVKLPPEGERFFTWDPVLKRIPNRASRRWATDRLVRFVLRVIREFSAAHPDAPRVGIGDLSRRRGGPFGPVHATHQNGLDADIYYPRLDRRERPPKLVSQIDRRLAQDLVDRFVQAGAKLVYVGPNTGFTGPRRVVRVLWNHDNHLHVRIRGTTD
jgi:murein endopeptidase